MILTQTVVIVEPLLEVTQAVVIVEVKGLLF